MGSKSDKTNSMKNLFFEAIALALLFSVVSCSGDKYHDEMMAVGDEWIDPVFALALQQRGYIADAKTVTPLDVSDITLIDVSGNEDNPGSIKSMRGLRYFTSLTHLRCAYNQITSLDVSKNKELMEFYYTNIRANEKSGNLVCRLIVEKN